MKRTLLPLLAFLFLATQLLAFQHVAAHGFEKHQHNGKPCEIETYYIQSQSFDSASNAPVIIIPAKIILPVVSITAENTRISFFAFKQPSQAPPYSLQS